MLFITAFLLPLLWLASIQCNLFSSNNPYITTELVIDYSNKTSEQVLNNTLDMQTYRQNIVPNYNLTLPNASGLAGILYDAGLLCESSQDKLSRFLPYQPKIALAQQGNCSLAHKAVVAQADGVAALIIYDNVPFDKDPYAGIMDIPASNLTLVVYYVDLNVGLDLLLKAQSTGPIVLGSDGISSQEAIRVILYPTTNGFPSAWEFTLIVIVVLLVLSFAISVGMHWHLWRIHRNHHALIEAGLLTTQNGLIKAQLINTKDLNIFPVRVIRGGCTSSARRLSIHSIRSHRSVCALANAETLANVDREMDRTLSKDNSIETVTRTADTEKSKEVAKDSSEGSSEDSLENLPENPPEDLPKDLPAERSLELAEEKSEVDTILSIPETREACVICLDEFSKGDTIRQLPCHHEYHCECIDPWLTIKSAACPLCKYDCSMNVPMPSQSIPPAHEEHYSFLSYFIHGMPQSSNSQSTGSFGPTVHADQIEQFNQSWISRSLPRNMRRQLQQAALAQTAVQEAAIELPERMASHPTAATTSRPSIPPVSSLSPPSSSSQPTPPPPPPMMISRIKSLSHR